ncbi:MAG TPA: DUF2275 domain-containing protein [Mycolicibacillus parakoreensis]|nr:DUF2275 domain-containing protein [Mycolicibacillus parakoreensis]
MKCAVVREALSARLDGEQQPLLPPGIDAHLQSCSQCRGWLVGAAAQTTKLATASARRAPDLTDQILATVRTRAASTASLWWRGALIAVGVGQIVVAAAQIGGLDFGMVHTEGHGAATGAHLLHESTAWLVGLGVAMIAAGIWTVAAVGVAAVTGAYAVALIGYVAVDAASGQVTAARALSHIPILVGLVFVLLVVRDRFGPPRRRGRDREAADPLLGAPLAEVRRRDHLRPVNRSAA